MPEQAGLPSKPAGWFTHSCRGDGFQRNEARVLLSAIAFATRLFTNSPRLVPNYLEGGDQVGAEHPAQHAHHRLRGRVLLLLLLRTHGARWVGALGWVPANAVAECAA